MLFEYIKRKRGVPEEVIKKRDFSDVDIGFIKSITIAERVKRHIAILYQRTHQKAKIKQLPVHSKGAPANDTFRHNGKND